MIWDPYLEYCLSQTSEVEKVEITEQIEGVFLQAKEENLPFINYPFKAYWQEYRNRRDIVFCELRKVLLGFMFIGAHVKNGHINFGLAKGISDYEDFKKKALECARAIIENNLFELK